MADDEKKILEGEFEFEAVVPDALFPQGKLKGPELNDEMWDEEVSITSVHMLDKDSLDNRTVVFEDDDIVKQAAGVFMRWIGDFQPREKGICITVAAELPQDDSNRVPTEVIAVFATRVASISYTPERFRNRLFYELILERMSIVDSVLDDEHEKGVEAGNEAGQESGYEAASAENLKCVEDLSECNESLVPTQNRMERLEAAIDEIGSRAIIIRGLHHGVADDPQYGEVGIYGPTGEKLRVISGESILDAWDDFGKGILEETTTRIESLPAGEVEQAPREMLNQITLRVRPTSTGPQITQRTGPSSEELKEASDDDLDGLGAIIKGVFRAKPAGVEGESLVTDRIVEIEKFSTKPQPEFVANLGPIRSIFIRGDVTLPGKKTRFVDLRPSSLDEADRLVWEQKWVTSRYGSSDLTIGFTSRMIMFTGTIRWPFSGLFRDLVVQTVWKKRLEDAEDRHKKDLEGENRQLGANQRLLKKCKLHLAFRIKELKDAGIEPAIFEEEPDEQGRLFEIAGLEPPIYTPSAEMDLGILEDDPGFALPMPHGLPACVVGNEKACQIEAKERMVQYGAAVLSTAELVAIVLSIDDEVALNMLRDHGGLIGLFKAPVGSLIRAKGVGKKTAIKVKAVSELSTRITASSENLFKSVIVQTPEDLAPLLRKFRLREVESFWIALLNARNRLIALREVCKGTIDACAVHPRDIFSVAILEGATGVILVHNHPSGNPQPSQEDISLTERMRDGAKTLGIRLMDHLIVAGDRVVSMRALGLW